MVTATMDGAAVVAVRRYSMPQQQQQLGHHSTSSLAVPIP
jgi:hypothetical protein